MPSRSSRMPCTCPPAKLLQLVQQFASCQHQPVGCQATAALEQHICLDRVGWLDLACLMRITSGQATHQLMLVMRGPCHRPLAQIPLLDQQPEPHVPAGGHQAHPKAVPAGRGGRHTVCQAAGWEAGGLRAEGHRVSYLPISCKPGRHLDGALRALRAQQSAQNNALACTQHDLLRPSCRPERSSQGLTVRALQALSR